MVQILAAEMSTRDNSYPNIILREKSNNSLD
jgi:hypothetical protein